jgi:hypothetical protein
LCKFSKPTQHWLKLVLTTAMSKIQNPHNLICKKSKMRKLFLMFYPPLQWAEILWWY